MRDLPRAVYAAVFFMIAVLMGLSIQALTSSNALGETSAGDGTGNISGYEISSIDYDLADDPTFLAQVEFDLTPAPGTAEVVIEIGGNTYDCATTGDHAVCDTSSPPLPVAEAEALRVIAA